MKRNNKLTKSYNELMMDLQFARRYHNRYEKQWPAGYMTVDI